MDFCRGLLSATTMLDIIMDGFLIIGQTGHVASEPH